MYTLKRWLNKLFAWWSWQRLASVDKPSPVRDVGWRVPPEGTWKTTAHGIEPATPQPGNISIAVEQQLNNQTVGATDNAQAQPPQANSNAFPPLETSSTQVAGKQCTPVSHPKEDATSDTERHLQFLRYLVQRGTFNDDLG